MPEITLQEALNEARKGVRLFEAFEKLEEVLDGLRDEIDAMR